MSESEPIDLRARRAHGGAPPAQGSPHHSRAATTAFDRSELVAILDLYGRKVAAGEWRDYAIDMTRDKAVFSVFRRACEYPLFRIEKVPKFARKQGAYAVVAATGVILKRGHDLRRVLGALEDRVRLVST